MTSLAVQPVASERARERVAPAVRSTQFLSNETSKVTQVGIQGKPSMEASGLELTHANLLDLSRLCSRAYAQFLIWRGKRAVESWEGHRVQEWIPRLIATPRDRGGPCSCTGHPAISGVGVTGFLELMFLI